MTAPVVSLDLLAEALFVSDLQPSESPSPKTLEKTVAAMLRRHGSEGCAGGVAEEFGEHPDCACARMRWARTAAAEAFEFEPARV